jgi:hypothetical protein
MVTPIDQLNMGLLPMQSMRPSGMNTMRSSLLGPVSNPPATSITPVNIGSQLAAAAQPTALGRARGALERNLFDPAMLRGLASGLLTGPTRTPVSMGQRLTTGLLAGQQMKEAEEQRNLERRLQEAKIQEAFKIETDLANVVDKTSGRVVGQVRVGSAEYNEALQDPQLFLDEKGSGLAGGITYETLLGLKESGVQDINTEYQTKLAATENLIMAGNKILETLDTEPDKTTAVGELLGSIANVKANVGAAARALGIDPEKSYTEDGIRYGFNEDHFSDIFDEFAVKSAVNKSRILDLAYLAAARRGQEGKGLSDRDVKVFSEIIGGSGSPKARYAKLEAYLDGTVEEFNLYRDRQINRYGDALKNPIPISSKVNIYQPQPKTVDTGLSPEAQEVFNIYSEQPNGDN